MYRTIVVGTDCSATAEVAVQRAAALARTFDATLHVVSAFRESVGSVLAASVASGSHLPEWQSSPIAERDASIDELAARLRATGVRVATTVDTGDAATTLVAVAERVGADLIVVGDRGMKGVRGVFASVPSSVTHKSPVDVLVVHTA